MIGNAYNTKEDLLNSKDKLSSVEKDVINVILLGLKLV